MPVNEVRRLLNSEEGVMKRGRIKKSRVSAVAVSLVVFFSVLANAQDEFELEQRGLSEESLAKQAQNPVGALISLPFQNNTNFDVGPRDRTQNVLNIQPVWPLSVSKG
jgi:hypothetical protein